MLQVCLITPRLVDGDPLSQRVMAQWQFFRERGDAVRIYSAAKPIGLTEPPGNDVHPVSSAAAWPDEQFVTSDLYVFHWDGPYELLEWLPKLTRGAALLYAHPAAPTSGAAETFSRVAAFADLVVVEGEPTAQLISDQYGYGSGPVRRLADGADYSILWAEVVAEVTAWLPNRPFPYGHLPAMSEVHPTRSAEQRSPSLPSLAAVPDALLAADLQALLANAKTMTHNYVVRSRLPIIGPLLAWLRRNLTSHLREPYIDPTFERQELYNQQVAQLLATIIQQEAATQATLHARIAELEARLAAFEQSKK